jgi:transcription-repair coupling factor (superfamily II helicase)
LRARVKEVLGETDAQAISSENMTQVVAQVDELLEIDPQDTRHLFWEEMKRIFYAMREVQLEDLDEETMDEFMAVMDSVSNVLYRIEKRRKSRELKIEKLKV